MPLHRRKDLELRSHADTIDVSMDSIDKDLDGIIADENSENTSNANALTIHKTSSDHDGRYYTESEWDTKETNILLDDESGKKHYHQAYARLLNPVFHLPLKNNIAMKRGIGSITYANYGIQFGDETFTYIDRYNQLQAETNFDTPHFGKYGLYCFYYVSPSYIGYAGCVDYPLDNSNNTLINTSVSVNNVNNPLGNLEADKVTASTTYSHETEHSVYVPYGGIYGDWVWNLSVFAKAGNTDYLFVGRTSNADELVLGRFNLSDGSCEEYTGTLEVSMDPVQDNWYRCNVRHYISQDATSVSARFSVGSTTGELHHTGDSKYLYLWGGVSDPYQAPTGIISPDTTSGYAGDIVSSLTIPKENVPPDSDGWTFTADIYFPEFNNSQYDATYRIFDSYNSPDYNLGVSRGKLYVNNALFYPTDVTQRIAGGFKRIVQTRDSTTTKIYVNGIKYLEEAYTPVALTDDLLIDYGMNNGQISNIRFYDFVVTDEEARIL